MPEQPPRICPKADRGNRFATPEVAARAAHDANAIQGKRFEPYPCACGWWHIGAALGNRRPNVDQYRTGPGKPPIRRKAA